MPAEGRRESTQSAQLRHAPAPLSESLYPRGDVGRAVEAVKGCGMGEEQD